VGDTSQTGSALMQSGRRQKSKEKSNWSLNGFRAMSQAHTHHSRNLTPPLKRIPWKGVRRAARRAHVLLRLLELLVGQQTAGVNFRKSL